MTNVQTKLDGHKLIVTIDLSENHGPSRTGKTTIIATTSGNQPIDGPDGETYHLGVNCYKRR